MFYKFKAVILIFLFSTFFQTLKAQYSYSIDIEQKKARGVSLKYTLTQAREQAKVERKIRSERRITNRESKKVRKHALSIQTRKVKKRMRLAYKKAENYNEGKKPFVVKLKRMLNG